MPPSKGRMLGRMTGPRVPQPKVAFKASKHLSCGEKPAPTFKSGHFKDVKHTEQLKKLRIPEQLCKSLPSVRRYANSKGYIDTTDNKHGTESNSDVKEEVFGGRKCRGLRNKYRIRQLSEKKFPGMIWNVEFLNTEDQLELVVSSGMGSFVCDQEFNVKYNLDKIQLSGGVSILSDQRIVAICRFYDVVNIYSPDGKFLSSFPGGDSPMYVAVNSKDEIIVSDVGAKCIRVFRPDGTEVRVIPQVGVGYQFKWPLYITVTSDDQIFVCDCHLQQLILFDSEGKYLRNIPLRTTPGNEVLRPHGICTADDDDFFVVDNATDSVDVFSKDGKYIQNIIPWEKGGLLKPKVIQTNAENSHLVVGGMSGNVYLYEFVDDEDEGRSTPHSVVIIEDDDEDVKPDVKSVIILD